MVGAFIGAIFFFAMALFLIMMAKHGHSKGVIVAIIVIMVILLGLATRGAFLIIAVFGYIGLRDVISDFFD